MRRNMNIELRGVNNNESL